MANFKNITPKKLKQVQLLVEDLYIKDQSVWTSKDSLEEIYEVINKNFEELNNKIIKKYGFLRPDVFGLKTAHYFYVLMVHADFYKDMQKTYYNWLKEQDLLDTLNIYKLKERIGGLKNPINLTKQEFLKKQQELWGLELVHISGFEELDYIKPFFTTTTLGNLSFRYGKSKDVIQTRKRLLEILNGNNKKLITIGNLKISRHDFVFGYLKSKDEIAYWPQVLQQAGIHKQDYDFTKLTTADFEEMGLAKDAIILTDLSSIKAGGLVVADCYIVMLFAPKQNIGALVHVGVPGLSLDILGKVIKRLQSEFNVASKDLYAILGPGILKDNYFYENVDRLKNIKYWKGFIKDVPNKGYQIDLFGALRNRMLNLGILFENYRITPRDTYSDKFLWSHYRSYHDGLPEGRFMVGFVNTKAK